MDYQALRAEMANEEYVPLWRPKDVGESVFGVLLGVEHGHTASSGNAYNVIVLEDPEDSTIIRIPDWHTALRGKFGDQRPLPGDSVLITYLGPAETKDKRSFFDYRVVVRDPNGRRIIRGASGTSTVGEPTPGATLTDANDAPARPMPELVAVHGTTTPRRGTFAEAMEREQATDEERPF